jgi:hypothetical protein
LGPIPNPQSPIPIRRKKYFHWKEIIFLKKNK